MNASKFEKFIAAFANKGITQQNAFQSFITGAVTALAGVGTLLMLNSAGLSLKQEILALIALAVSCIGIIMAIISYILLLVLRLGQAQKPSEAPSPSDEEPGSK